MPYSVLPFGVILTNTIFWCYFNNYIEHSPPTNNIYSSANRILIQIEHILIHKANLNEFERIDIIWNNFSGCSGVKIEIKEKNGC